MHLIFYKYYQMVRKYNILLILALLVVSFCRVDLTQNELNTEQTGDTLETLDQGDGPSYKKMLKLMYLFNKYVLSEDSNSSSPRTGQNEDVKQDEKFLSFSQRYQKVMRLRLAQESCESKSTQFKLVSTSRPNSLYVQLHNYRDYSVYAGEFNENHIGLNIHKNLELLDVYEVMCTSPENYEGLVNFNETIMKNTNDYGQFRVSSEGVVTVQTVADTVYHKEVFYSFLKLDKVRKMTQTQILKAKQYIQRRNQLSQLYQQNRALREQNSKLREQLKQFKPEPIKEDKYRGNMHQILNPQNIQYVDDDQQFQWLPLLIFSGFGGFIIYNIIKTERNVKKYTIANRFENWQSKTEQFRFTESSITKMTTGDWVRLVDSSQIYKRKQYKLKIKSMEKWPINLGLVSVNRMQDGVQKDKVLLYGSNRIYYNDNVMKLKEGQGFNEGETVKIIVDLMENFIKWQVDGETRYILDEGIKGKVWKLMIEMRGNGDSIEWIE